MEQKTTWMRYLIFGVINIILFSMSCIKRFEYEQFGQFYFVNQTNYPIKLENKFYDLSILPGKTSLIEQIQGGAKVVTADSFRDPFTQRININPEKVIFKMGDKCFNPTKDSEHSPLNIKNYVAERINKTTYKFTYTFTEADYNRAVTCP